VRISGPGRSQLGAKRSTLNEVWLKELRGEDQEPGSITINPDELPASWTADQILREHGRDPEEYIVYKESATRWGDPEKPFFRLRLDYHPKKSLLLPPDPSDWTPPPKPKRRKLKENEARKVAIVSDHHCPLEDRQLHSCFLQWLEDEKPDEGVILGDLLDFSSISRHRRGKRKAPATPNECLRSALHVLRDYRHASPDTFWTILPGNHDDRLEHQQIDNTPGLYGVAPGGGETLDGKEDLTPAQHLRRLLYLDDLGIDCIDEDYNRAKLLLGKKLTLRHGYLSGKNASQNMLAKVGHSTVQGHTHRLRMIYKTEHDEHDPEDPTVTRIGAEAGCMAQIADGLQYDDQPDWQQGFLVAHLWPNDDFTLTPIPYVPGRLLAPGRRYE